MRLTCPKNNKTFIFFLYLQLSKSAIFFNFLYFFMKTNNAMPFGKTNYRILFLAIATLLLGFIIMSLDTEKHGFGFMGLTLGPVIVMVGFLIPFFAILKKDKKAE